MVSITSEPIDPSRVFQQLSSQGAGSVVFHFAAVKPMKGEGGTTCYIDFATDGDAEAELRGIAEELSESYNLVDALLIRRTGRLALGDIISLAAVSSPSSEDAFAACKDGITRLRRMKTMVKHEVCG